MLLGQVLIGGPWHLAIDGKGASTPELPGQWTLGFWKGSCVQELCPDSLILGDRGRKGGQGSRLWFQMQGTMFFPLHKLWLHDLVYPLQKATQHFTKQDRTILSCFCSYNGLNPLTIGVSLGTLQPIWKTWKWMDVPLYTHLHIFPYLHCICISWIAFPPPQMPVWYSFFF